MIWGTVLTTLFSNLLVPGLYVFRELKIDLRTYLQRTLTAPLAGAAALVAATWAFGIAMPVPGPEAVRARARRCWSPTSPSAPSPTSPATCSSPPAAATSPSWPPGCGGGDAPVLGRHEDRLGEVKPELGREHEQTIRRAAVATPPSRGRGSGIRTPAPAAIVRSRPSARSLSMPNVSFYQQRQAASLRSAYQSGNNGSSRHRHRLAPRKQRKRLGPPPTSFSESGLRMRSSG